VIVIHREVTGRFCHLNIIKLRTKENTPSILKLMSLSSKLSLNCYPKNGGIFFSES
jgi:hypothetical protein